jgi:hypothetical protein
LRAFLLEVPRVREEDAREVARGGGDQHLPREPLPDEHGKVAGVVQVGVRENHEVEPRGIHGKRLPVPEPEVLEPLEEPAIHQHPKAVVLDQELRTCDGARAAEVRESAHARSLSA